MSIDRRFILSDNHGACPCVPPLVLGRYLDHLNRSKPLSLTAKISRALANLQRRLGR
jgi:hypothetical protein